MIDLCKFHLDFVSNDSCSSRRRSNICKFCDVIKQNTFLPYHHQLAVHGVDVLAFASACTRFFLPTDPDSSDDGYMDEEELKRFMAYCYNVHRRKYRVGTEEVRLGEGLSSLSNSDSEETEDTEMHVTNTKSRSLHQRTSTCTKADITHMANTHEELHRTEYSVDVSDTCEDEMSLEGSGDMLHESDTQFPRGFSTDTWYEMGILGSSHKATILSSTKSAHTTDLPQRQINMVEVLFRGINVVLNSTCET